MWVSVHVLLLEMLLRGVGEVGRVRRGLDERLALHVESGADLVRIRVSEGLVTVSIVVIVGIIIIIINFAQCARGEPCHPSSRDHTLSHS